MAKLGSRNQIIFSDAFFVVGGLCCVFAQGAKALMIGRLVSGLGLGVAAIQAPCYIAEISPRELRGGNCAMHGLFITIGIFASITFGLPQDPPPSGEGDTLEGLNRWYWRFLLGFQVLPAIAQAACMRWIVPLDTPPFLVSEGRISEARAMLYRAYGLDDSTVSAKERTLLDGQLDDLIVATKLAQEAPRVTVISALFDPWLRCAVLVGVFLTALQQLSGINALMSYSNGLFLEAGIQPEYLTLASTAMATANCMASALSARVVDEWGRKKLLLVGCFFQTVSMAVMVGAGSGLAKEVAGPLAVMCFSVFVTSFSAGLGAITWLYLSEIYPLEIRGPALSFCGVVNWLCSFTVVFGSRFLTLTESCKLFGCVCAVGFIGVQLWVVETKGCSMDDSPMTPFKKRHTSTLLSPMLTPR